LHSIWVHPRFLVGSVVLIFLVFCVVFLVLFVFVLCLVYPMLPVYLDCPFLIAPSVCSKIYLRHFTANRWALNLNSTNCSIFMFPFMYIIVSFFEVLFVIWASVSRDIIKLVTTYPSLFCITFSNLRRSKKSVLHFNLRRVLFISTVEHSVIPMI